MITPNAGLASFHAPNRNKLTVPTASMTLGLESGKRQIITYVPRRFIECHLMPKRCDESWCFEPGPTAVTLTTNAPHHALTAN